MENEKESKNKILKTNLSPEDLLETPSEFKRFLASIYCLEQYSKDKEYDINKIQHDFESLDQKYLSKLSFDYKKRISRLKESVQINQKFLDDVIKIYKPSPSYYRGINMEEILKLSYDECSYIETYIFKYIMRDWSKEGKKERNDNYDLILNDVKKYFNSEKNLDTKYKFLIPGCGLFRLGYEIAKMGHKVDAVDYCFFNVIFCDYMFNYCEKDQYKICPLLKSFINWMKEDGPFKQFDFPEEDIKTNLPAGRVSMIGGDFDYYFANKTDEYDCVITCFFIDTAQNVLRYMEIIRNVLKKGGVWINFGPLTYHWTGSYDGISIELSYEDVKQTAINYGFEFVNENDKNVYFCEMEDNMKNDLYRCAYFTAIKK